MTRLETQLLMAALHVVPLHRGSAGFDALARLRFAQARRLLNLRAPRVHGRSSRAPCALPQETFDQVVAAAREHHALD